MPAYRELTVLQGTMDKQVFHFTMKVNGRDVHFVLDTKAYELTFNADVAQALDLPNLGSVQSLEGLSADAYRSECTVSIGHRTFSKAPCVVEPTSQSPARLGLNLFVDNHLALLLDTTSMELLFLSPQR
jgi:hypothetical protein